jgi:hypothetical protein
MPEGVRLYISGQRVGDTSPNSHLNAAADERGRFVLNGLLPGEYEISAHGFLTSLPGDAQPRFRPATQKVTVTNGAESQVVLTLQPANRDN